MTKEPKQPHKEAFHVQTDEELHAVGSLARHRVMKVLRDKPATITQVAEHLGIAKGSANYHMKVLEKAGLIRVVETNKVRGVIEKYYGMAARKVVLPEGGPGEPDHLMRFALADLEASPTGPRTVILSHTRLAPEVYEEFRQRLETLVEEFKELNDPTQPRADLFVAMFRPDHEGAGE